MSGRVFAAGTCWACGRLITFDPELVPSVPVDPVTDLVPDLGGDAERAILRPVCRECVDLANEARTRIGRSDLIYVPPGAYFP